MLYNQFDSSTGTFHTFPNFGKYHEFSFLLYGGTMHPQDKRAQVDCLIPSHFHFRWIKIRNWLEIWPFYKKKSIPSSVLEHFGPH
jgi:hypothetical protein